jgi:hypothetical protein
VDNQVVHRQSAASTDPQGKFDHLAGRGHSKILAAAVFTGQPVLMEDRRQVGESAIRKTRINNLCGVRI